MHARGALLVSLAAMAAGLVGCNTVPQVEYDALQQKYNAMSDQNMVLKKDLEAATEREGRLLVDLRNAGARATRAEQRSAQLQNQMASRPTPAPAAPAQPGPRDGTKISIGSDTLFASGQATLSSAGRSRVAKLAATIKGEHAGGTVLVYGHTDGDKIRKSKWKDNLELSAQRAMAVTRELIRAGVPAKKIETVAMGESRPVASNRTGAGKARNRRVVVFILQ